MADAVLVREWDEQRLTASAAVAIGEVWQTADGKAAVYVRVAGSASVGAGGTGDRCDFRTSGKYTITKATGVVILDGGRVYWDHSANNVTYKKVNDRDFYMGRAVGDAASADATVVVDINIDPPYDLDLARDTFRTVFVGTRALGGLDLLRRGGAHNIVLSSTSEAQKVDMLGNDGFAVGANAIVEIAFNVVSDGAGTVVDVSLGIANATHASDADSITESMFVHLDANNVNINLESDDGTTEVAATDTTVDYTEGAAAANRVEVWFDMRNPADIQAYVNGVNVLPATTFTLDAATGPLRLLAHVEKSAAADTYELDVEWMRARFAEQ